MSHFASYIEYLIHRIFNTHRCLFAFTSVVCSTFNFNEKVACRQVLIRFIDRSVRAYFFGPPAYLYEKFAQSCSTKVEEAGVKPVISSPMPNVWEGGVMIRVLDCANNQT